MDGQPGHRPPPLATRAPSRRIETAPVRCVVTDRSDVRPAYAANAALETGIAPASPAHVEPVGLDMTGAEGLGQHLL